MAKQDATVDPEVQKWLDENAISTGKADINLVVTEGHNGDTIKLKDATTKLLALARHLLSFAPGIRPPKEERPLLAVTEEGNDY